MFNTLFIPSIHSKGVYKELTIQYWHINNPLRVGIALATQIISDWPAEWAECVWLVDSWVDCRAGPHMGQSVHILLGENRRGADRTCLQLRLGERGEGPIELVCIHMWVDRNTSSCREKEGGRWTCFGNMRLGAQSKVVSRANFWLE